MRFELVTGRHLLGRIKRFDRFAVVMETDGKEILVYKHAIAMISPTSGKGEATHKTPNYEKLIRVFDPDEADQWGWDWDSSSGELRFKLTGSEP